MKSIWTKLGFLISLFVVIWLGLSWLVLANADSIIFHPLKTYYTYPGLPPYTQFLIPNSSGQKQDFRYYKGTNLEKLVIYFHGNGGLATQYIPELLKQGNVLSASYPGYLNSEGEPSWKMIYETGDQAYQKALDLGYKESDIIIWGHSLGGAVAINQASKHPDLNKTILVNIFNNMQSMCDFRLRFLCIFGKDILPSDRYAAQIKGKVRQFHDINDKTVPFELGSKLYDNLATKDKKFQQINGDHNQFDIAETFED
jgi:pimeloyl-ACP methyl ester carboxylesterase